MEAFIVPQSVIENANDVFQKLDPSGTGFIDAEDIREALTVAGIECKREELAAVMEGCGASKLTTFDKDSMIQLFMATRELKRYQEGVKSEALVAFEMLRGDSNGQLESSSFKNLINKFELEVDWTAIRFGGHQPSIGENGLLEEKDFISMFSDVPSAEVFSGKHVVKEREVRLEDFSSQTKDVKKDNSEKHPGKSKSSEAKNSNVNSDESKSANQTGYHRKQFEFMDSLAKQYNAKKRSPLSSSSIHSLPSSPMATSMARRGIPMSGTKKV